MKKCGLDHLTLAAAAFVAAVGLAVSTMQARAQQIPLPTSAAQVPGPAPGTAMTDAYVQAVGRMAYVWGWPLVNSHNRRAALAKVPEPGRNGGVLPVAPIGRIAMLNDYRSNETKYIYTDYDAAGKQLDGRRHG